MLALFTYTHNMSIYESLRRGKHDERRYFRDGYPLRYLRTNTLGIVAGQGRLVLAGFRLDCRHQMMRQCHQCFGDGEIEYTVPVVDWDRGGFLKGVIGECDVCKGEGYLEVEDEEDLD